MVINTISDIKKIVLEIVLITVAIFIVFYLLLLNGIKIENLHFKNISVEQFYLKLNKKLILKAKNIHLASTDQKGELPNPGMINYFPKLFEYVELKNIRFANRDFDLYYKDQNFIYSDKNISIKASIKSRDNKVVADVEKFSVKNFGLDLNGTLITYKDRAFFKGRYSAENIRGSIQIKRAGKKIKFIIDSKPFSNRDLARFFSHIKLNNEIKSWSYEKVRAKKYKLIYLTGIYDIKKGLERESLRARAEAEDVIVKFHPNVEPVGVKKVVLSLKNDSLFFNLQKPSYEGIDLSGSKVQIISLGKNSYIDIFIKTAAPFDERIKKILKAYRIEVPLTQKRGLTDANLRIRVVLKTLKTGVKGAFTAQNSLFEIKGVEIGAKRVNVTLKNGFIKLQKSDLYLDGFLKAQTEGYIDLLKDIAKFNLKKLNLELKKEGVKIIKLKDKTADLTIYPNKNLILSNRLNLKVLFDKGVVIVDNLQDFKSYSDLLKKIDPTYAKLIYDFRKKRANLELEKPNRMVIKEGKPVKRFHIYFDEKSSSIKINRFFEAKIGKKLSGYIKNIDLNLSGIMKKRGKKDLNISADFAILNSDILYNSFTLPVKRGRLNLNGGEMKFKGINSNDKLEFVKKTDKTRLFFKARGETVNEIIGKNHFEGGIFTLKAFGVKERLEGTLDIKEGYIKNLKTLNNLFATLNTIPAFATLSDPGFSSKGMLIKNGKIEFVLRKDYLILTNINLKSTSFDIAGNGVVDMKKGKIFVRLKLKTLKKISSLVSKIPIAGYILLGDDGSISTSVEIKGDLNDPKIKSLLPQESIKMPFNIIKRTLQLPFKIFE